MSTTDVDTGIQAYEQHLMTTARVFNDYARLKGLDIQMAPDRAIQAIKDGIGLARVAPFWSRSDDTGIVHDSQLQTAVECIIELLADQKRCGHVVGAMQSGKTTTSLALQWAGPILYLLTGRRAYPFYIIGNQRNHEDQTTIELERFLAYYGNVELRSGGTPPHSIDGVFERSPSLSTYREHVLPPKDVYEIPQLEDIVHRRVGGEQSLRRIVELCRQATEQGYRPLMIIDEPQFGASDRFVEGDAGVERRTCVLAKIFDRIEQALGSTRDDHWFVGLSATPFEMNDLQRFWEVRQSLTTTYSGFNFFNGRPIADDVEVTPPTTLSLTAFAQQSGVAFLADVSMAAYEGRPSAFDRHARKIGYEKDQDAYRRETETALRAAIYHVLDTHRDDPDGPVGLCIRAFNDNRKTQALVERLALDPERIEVLPYYGNDTGGMSVKRMIARRARPDLPYLVLVTNRARMADAFPKRVRFFMDLAQKASDLNALLQGLLGRACGYGKRSTVVLSDANAEIVRAYVATTGGYVYKTSRHSVTVGAGFRRGAPTGMLKLRAGVDDNVVQQFFERIDAEIVSPNIAPGATMKVPRRKQRGVRMGPILRIAEEIQLFQHVEQPTVRTALFPELITGFNVVRRGETIRHSRNGEMLTYTADDEGNCRYTFRHSSRELAARGGAAGRAKGAKDVDPHIEPTIYVEKFDPITGAVIADKDAPGHWRAFMVTFPLREPVREVRVAEVAYPVEHSPFNDYMTEPEKDARTHELGLRADHTGAAAHAAADL
jgi:hypothetical protein